MRNMLTTSCLALALACGSEPTDTTTTGGPGESSSGDATTTTTAATGSTTMGTSTGSQPTSTGGSGTPLAVSLESADVWASCGPQVPRPIDEVNGKWTILYDNSAGATEASAELVKATLVLADDDTLTFALTAQPSQSGPIAAGQTLMQEQEKQSSQQPLPGCDHCDQPYALELVFASGGVEIVLESSGSLTCVS